MSDNGNGEQRFFHTNRISLSVLLAFALQAVTFTIWLTNMRADVNQLQRDLANLASDTRAQYAAVKAENKIEHDSLQKRMEVLDERGTRALDVVRNRQNDVISLNSAQDARMRDLETKLTELQRISVENRFLIDQALTFVRTYSHQPLPPLPRGTPP